MKPVEEIVIYDPNMKQALDAINIATYVGDRWYYVQIKGIEFRVLEVSDTLKDEWNLLHIIVKKEMKIKKPKGVRRVDANVDKPAFKLPYKRDFIYTAIDLKLVNRYDIINVEQSVYSTSALLAPSMQKQKLAI